MTMLIVSHNRAFLNEVVQEIIFFRNKTLIYHVGNYDQVMDDIADKALFSERVQGAVDKKKAAMEASLKRNVKLASKQRDDKKLKQIASKKVKMEERIGYERNAKGHRFKLNRDRAGYHFSLFDDTPTTLADETSSKLSFTLLEPDLPRFNGPLLVVEDVAFKRVEVHRVLFELTGVTFAAEPGEKIALLGPNGQGKSTILNMLSDIWTPASGTITKRVNNVGYFRQDVVHQLGMIDKSPIERMSELFPQAKQADLIQHLGAYGLGSSLLATQTPVSKLSGGQRVAFAFAELGRTSPALLLLDEPSIHLDIDALNALGENLACFSGAIVFVSHDLSFVDDVATGMYWVCDGKCEKMENGLEEVDQRLKKRTKKEK